MKSSKTKIIIWYFLYEYSITSTLFAYKTRWKERSGRKIAKAIL